MSLSWHEWSIGKCDIYHQRHLLKNRIFNNYYLAINDILSSLICDLQWNIGIYNHTCLFSQLLKALGGQVHLDFVQLSLLLEFWSNVIMVIMIFRIQFLRNINHRQTMRHIPNVLWCVETKRQKHLTPSWHTKPIPTRFIYCIFFILSHIFCKIVLIMS